MQHQNKKAVTDHPSLAAIAGGSGSGKSTICSRLQNRYEGIEHVKLDDYFHDPGTYPKINGWRNWELPECLDFEQLAKNLEHLKSGSHVTGPSFDKASGNHSTRTLTPRPIVLVEGFLVLYEPRVRELMDVKIYLKTSSETMLRRRLYRGGEPEPDYLREVVLPFYKRYGTPTRKFADYTFDAEADTETLVCDTTEILQKMTSHKLLRHSS